MDVDNSREVTGMSASAKGTTRLRRRYNWEPGPTSLFFFFKCSVMFWVDVCLRVGGLVERSVSSSSMSSLSNISLSLSYGSLSASSGCSGTVFMTLWLSLGSTKAIYSLKAGLLSSLKGNPVICHVVVDKKRRAPLV